MWVLVVGIEYLGVVGEFDGDFVWFGVLIFVRLVVGVVKLLLVDYCFCVWFWWFVGLVVVFCRW